VPQTSRVIVYAERDLVDFLRLVTARAALYLGDHANRVTAALCRALDLPVPGTSALRS